MARLISRTFSADTRLAFGWTLNTTALPADTIAIVLLMMVEVGLVVGVIGRHDAERRELRDHHARRRR